MASFLCKFMCWLVISVALFLLAPIAAADSIVILPNGTLTGASFSFESGTSSGGETLTYMIVDVPQAGNPDLTPEAESGQHLSQVILEVLYPGTDSPEETVTLQDCLITAVSFNSGTETIDFEYAQASVASEPAPPGPPVPEPSSLGLLGAGLLGLLCLAKFKA
ncbi:MAG TPA: PEP-CTERM sorting domain-containing protein [Candidatus Limnocylindrales bacterium]|nr:PEP-CTERM sorting domain-containing protein [Candidatus Limnocylindrales bacterium]